MSDSHGSVEADALPPPSGGHGHVYRVIDRSLLLPIYKKLVIAPALRFIPSTIHPNTLTHLGHVVALVAVSQLLLIWPKSGWPYLLAAALVQLYCWLDNVDGGHARRTGQTSVLGEFLDHGLDSFTVCYIGMLTAMSLGAPPLAWVLIASFIPGAAALTYWEQAETGTMHLGLLNQVESLLLLSTMLTVCGLFGADVYERIKLGPVSLRTGVLVWVITTILFGKIRGIVRVLQNRGFALRYVAPALPFLALDAALVGSAWVSAISYLAAVIIGCAATTFGALRMLLHRIVEEPPQVDLSLSLAAGVLGAASFAKMAGVALAPSFGLSLAVVAVVVFGFQIVADGRRGLAAIATLQSKKDAQKAGLKDAAT